MKNSQESGTSDVPCYAAAVILGIAAGILDVKVGDLLLTAMFVLASTMVLGFLRPQHPWRWIVAVASFIPLVQLLAFAFFSQKPYRAQIYESFLGFLTGIAGKARIHKKSLPFPQRTRVCFR
jgi:hypothetical protein